MFHTYSDVRLLRTPILEDNVPEKFMDDKILKANSQNRDKYKFMFQNIS